MNNKYLFLHIPKTAGSSLYALFANILGPENVKQVPNTNNLGLRQIDMLKKYMLVGGHFTYSHKKCFENRYCMVILRNPIDRFLSQYYFHRGYEGASDPAVINAKNLDLSSYIEFYRNQKYSGIFNAQLWHLAGLRSDTTVPMKELLNLAKDNLSKLDFTGIYEFFSDSIDLLLYDCKWPPVTEIPVVNVTSKRPKLHEIHPKIVERIAELNQYDLELYEYGVDLFNQKKRNILRECIKKNHEMWEAKLPDILTVTPKEDAILYSETPKIFGSNEIRIISADVYSDVSGASIIKSGEMATIGIYFESSISSESITVGFSIEDEYKQIIFGTNSFHLGKELRVKERQTYCATYNLRLNIGEGLYQLNASVHSKSDTTEKCYHWWEHICGFQVAGQEVPYCIGISRLNPYFMLDQVRQMLPLTGETLKKIRLKVKEIHTNALFRQTFFAVVQISNGSGDVISSCPPYPVYLSYHWMNAGDGQLVVFDGERSQIKPPLLPLGEGRYRIRIIAPDSAGEYILRLTLVQEGVIWFDSLSHQVYEDVSFKVGAE